MARKTRDPNLTARQVQTLPEGFYSDGLNLYLRVRETGTRSWVFRYTRGGKVREIGLGPTHTVSLARARELARLMRSALVEGRDPKAALAAERPSVSVTFAECARELIAQKRHEWRNEKHAAQWSSSLETYAYPFIGNLSPAAIELPHILEVLKPIWTAKTETATRLRQRIEAVLDYAAVHGFRDREKVNPARWRGNLDKILPKPTKLKKVRHHAALPYRRVPEVMAALARQRGTAALALRFIILTAARSGEVRRARWCEISDGLWTVPAERMKANREHIVPLSEAAQAVLDEAREISSSELIFPGERSVLSDVAANKALRQATDEPVTVHGFRSSFRDWAAEQTSYPREVIELCLAHVNKDRVEAAYLRSTVLEKRRKLMQAWGGFCMGVDNVLPLRTKA